MAVKTSWAAGDVLLAADLTDTFAAKAPLASPAFTGTPTVGGTAITALAGLQIVTPTSIAYSSGSASVSGGEVTFSGVGSISLNGCFTTSYTNYKVIVHLAASASAAILSVRFRASGADNTSAVYQVRGYSSNNTALVQYSYADQTAAAVADNLATTSTILVFDCLNPQASKYTQCPFTADTATATVLDRVTSGSFNFLGTNSFDGFSLITNSGTLAGTARVYGYRNS